MSPLSISDAIILYHLNVVVNHRLSGNSCTSGEYTLKRAFALSAALILIATGVAKVASACGSAKLLSEADPIVGIQFRHLLLIIGFVELSIGLVSYVCKGSQIGLMLVSWLATSFVIYRAGLWWMGWHRPCSCLGNLTDALHIPPQLADNIMKGILAYLLIGGYGLLIWQGRRRTCTVDTGAGLGVAPGLGD